MYLSLAATSGTAGTSRFDWYITLALICAMFIICLTIVVRGNRMDPDTPRTRRQKLRLQRARRGLWVLVALFFLTLARIIWVAPH